MLEEKKHLEIKTLLEGYPFLKQVLLNIKQAVWILDLNTDRIVYVSPSFETVWGIPCENLYTDPLTLIKSIHPEDRVKVLADSPDVYRTSMRQSYRIIRPDGSLRWISAQIFLIHDDLSEASYQVCVAQDISDHNQVDMTLRKALDRSRELFTLSRRMSLARKPEAALRTLMSSSELRTANLAYVLFFDTPPSGRFREIDIIASWTSVSGLPPLIESNAVNETRFHESNLFEDLALLDLFHPSNPVIVSGTAKDPRLTPAVRDLLQTAHIQTAAFFPMVTLGNWLGCLLVFFSQVKQFDPVELRHIKVLVDQATITIYNLQLLETEAESRHEAERANEIKTRFLAMISHELRTPLTSIKGFTTTLLAQDVTWQPSEQRDFILTIELEANRLQELIDHLLDLSRLDAGMLPISMETHSLQDIVQDALSQIHILTVAHTLTLHLPDNLPPVQVDAKRIAQVLVNLVKNASTYASPGTEIDISAYIRRGYVQINVSDQGPGIPPGDHKGVFKAFRRGVNAENSSVKGAGLGLAICKGLVEAHGGRIWIKKKNTPGATFCFTLPLVPLEPPAKEN